MKYNKGDFISDIRNVFYRIEEFYSNEEGKVIAKVKNLLTEKENFIPINEFKYKLEIVENNLLDIILNDFINNCDIFIKKGLSFEHFCQKHQGVIKDKAYKLIPLNSSTLKKDVCFFRRVI